MAAIVYSPDCHFDIGSHIFSASKYSRLHDALIERRLAAPSDFIAPDPMPWDDLALVHTDDYRAISIPRDLDIPHTGEDGMMDEVRGTVLKHEEIYKGRIFSVVRDRVRLPNGVEATLEVVRHPGSVVLLPMPDPEHVILVKQYRYAIDRWVWELAAGSLNPGEAPADGAARECEEETGLAAGRVQFVGAFYPTPGYCDEKMNFFKLTMLAVPDSRPAASPDEDEDIRTRSFSLAGVREMITRAEIDDLKTAVGLTLI